ncbi:MAG TPA: efflux RND transporter permease subunit, partial [Anaeromyxobacteraceae bacterium]|nr:efflux RND transporter permease subunit [Anaeromyxobacteraceae bacterium]
MRLTDVFIKRPVIAIVVNLVIVIAGLQAIRSLNVRQYPHNENADITVTTTYVGANAELVRGFITTPLERVIASADGIEYLESESRQNVSFIRARLKLNHDATRALAEISAKVDQVRGDLPPEAEVPILNIETADSQFAAAYLSFSSDFLKANEITDYLVRVVQPRLSALEGIQRADILGARTFAMRIWLQPDRMAAVGVSPADVRQALEANNYLAAVGQTRGSLVQVNLTANTDISSPREFERLVVREQNGAVVRLGDVATVALGAEDYDAEVNFSGQTAVFIGIWALPNANTLDVMERVRTEMAAIQKDLPAQITGVLAYDATEYIQNAIHEVVSTLGETLIIVVIVIFLFLGSLRSVLVPIVAIPVSLIGAVFLMQLFGFSVNLLTLLAIVLSVGLVVDDAIVVVENVERHLREGMRPVDAAIRGARELVGPVIAMTITLAAVYAPIAFQGGLTGSLFREFALTLAGAVTVSGVVALTLSPMMSAALLRRGEQGAFARRIDRAFDRVREAYARRLETTLASRGALYAAWGVVTVLTLVMFTMVPRELAPNEDQGVIFGIVDTPSNATLEQLGPFTREVHRSAMSIPEAGFTFQITNPTGGFWGVGLQPWKDRERTAFEILPEVQAKVAAIPGIRTFPVVPPALPGGGSFPVELVIASTADSAEVLGFAQKLQAKAVESGMFAFPPLIDVKVDQPSSEIEIDREKVAELGLDLRTVAGDVGAAVGGNYVNRFSIDGRSYKVIPQLVRSERLNPEQLEDVHVTGPDGRLIPLASIARIRDTVKPRTLNRFQQLNAVKISGVAIRPLDEALSFLEDEAAQILPSGYVIDYTGESRQLRTEGSKFLPAFLLAMVLIFLVLAAQFNSFRDPFVILAGSVPLAMFGAVVMMFLKMPNPNLPSFSDGWTTTLNVYSQVGLVTLVGLVAKNGILIVEFANKLQESGLDKLEAVKQAAITRLRPILMTSVATVVGHFPLTLVSGPGAEARNSIGLVLVVGMAVGTVFTLFFLPAIYVLVARSHRAPAHAGVPAAPGEGFALEGPLRLSGREAAYRAGQ